MKRLIVCFDGTWNTPDAKKNPTNVVKLMHAIRSTDDNGIKQVTFYDKGVGTGNFINRFRGGAFGRGLGDNVKDGYRFLANNHETKDEIYIFGFSRGAFTARSLAGMIGVSGLLIKRKLDKLPRAWAFYRMPHSEREQDTDEKSALDKSTHQKTIIRCVGVWDTVGALGVPSENLRILNGNKYKFHNMQIGESIDCALHAIAIDEKRGPFYPTLWETPLARENQVVEQVWFPGVHSNVGGSYDKAGLSDLTLDWMIKRVKAHTKLAFDKSHIKDKVKPNALCKIYESRSLIYLISRVVPYQRVIFGAECWIRRFWRRSNRPKEGETYLNEALHEGTVKRFGNLAPYNGSSVFYAPKSIYAALRMGVPIVAEIDGNQLVISERDALSIAALARLKPDK